MLDPLRDPRWPCDFITDDQDHFLDVFWSNQSCMAFLDEGGESVGRYDKAMQKTATRGRHNGHACHYIAQDATQLAPIVRAQCRHLFLFCSAVDSGKVLAREFNRPELVECSGLKIGEYIHAVKMGEISTNRRTKNAQPVNVGWHSACRSGDDSGRSAGEEKDDSGAGRSEGEGKREGEGSRSD